MSISRDIGILVRSCGAVIGTRRVDRTLDFYDLLRALSEITGLDLRVYSLNVSCIINNGNTSSSYPIRNNNDLRFFFHPQAGLNSVELLVEVEMKVQYPASHGQLENQYYPSEWSDRGGANMDKPSLVAYEAPQVNHNEWGAWEDEPHQCLGSSHAGGSDPNIGSSGITKMAPAGTSIADIEGDLYPDFTCNSEPSDNGSEDEGPSDEDDTAPWMSSVPNSLMPRVRPHPNLVGVPFFDRSCNDVPVDSLGVPSSDRGYDADDGVLRLGMIFKDKDTVINVVKDYSIRHARREYRVEESNSKSMKLVCKQNYASENDNCSALQHCEWHLRASYRKRFGHWEITRLGPPHTCLMDIDSRSHSNLCKNLLAADLESLIQVEPAYDVKCVVEHADKKYNYTISYQKAWQALKRARENVFGTWESSCQYLPKYMRALQKYNPGTIVEWKHKDTIERNVHTLRYVFWAFKPYIEAFMHCRKILCVDGTHLYTKYKHKLLIAKTLDANQKIISVAYAIVDDESYKSWKWFLNMLATHVVGDIEGVCLISDRHKGILKAVNEVPAFSPPRGVHRYCLRHVASNFNTQFKSQKLKDLCYIAGRALSVRHFEIRMNEIRVLSEEGHEYLRNIDPTKWTFCHDGGHRFGVMTTNISECINGVLKGARRLPITAIVSATFTRSKNVFMERAKEAGILVLRNRMWPDHVNDKFDSAQREGMKYLMLLHQWGNNIEHLRLNFWVTHNQLHTLDNQMRGRLNLRLKHIMGYPHLDMELTHNLLEMLVGVAMRGYLSLLLH